jgi:3',5'-cyclic AMP phosphodiesterase CpdA
MLILHLSDLHYGPQSRFAGLDPKPLAKAFGGHIRRIREEFALGPAVDLVVVSGDVVETALPADYRAAGEFLTRLGGELGLEHRRFVFCPGNHDVDTVACEHVALDRKKERFDDAEFRRRMDATKLDEYHAFLRTFYGVADLSEVFTPLDQHAALYVFENLRLSVAALNSCERYSHLPEHRRGEIGRAQARAVMDSWRTGRERDWLKILVLHHNPAGDVPQNVRSWREVLLSQAQAGKLDKDLLAAYEADLAGFEGSELLKSIVGDCSVQLVLHGHHHALDENIWPWRQNGQAHVLSAGSWALSDDKLPAEQPN